MTLLDQIALRNNRNKLSYLHALKLLAEHCSQHSGLNFRDHWKASLMVAKDEVEGLHPDFVEIKLQAYIAEFNEWVMKDLDDQHKVRRSPKPSLQVLGEKSQKATVYLCSENNSGVTL